jgi:hypothetical protein
LASYRRRARVRAAFRAAADRAARGRLRAAERACFESAFFDAALRPSLLSVLRLAVDRREDEADFPRRPAL